MSQREIATRPFSFGLAGLFVALLVVATQAAPPERPREPAGHAVVSSLLDEFNSSTDDGRVLHSVERDADLAVQALRSQVDSELRHARRTMRDDPRAVVRRLKMLLDTLRVAPDASADVRTALARRVETVLRASYHRRQEKDERDRLRHSALAAQASKRLSQDQFERDQRALSQLVQRFNSLIAEGEHRLADEVIGAQVEKLDRRGVLQRGASRSAGLAGNRRDALVMRKARDKGVIASLHQVEKAATATADDLPITYPDAEIWEELTLRRAKYASVDLSTPRAGEQRIMAALKEETDVEFLETPLIEVVEFLKDLHNIEIQLDRRALADAGFGEDVPVTRHLKGISLRSALRLMLRDLELTYEIRDEVLLITTPEEAELNLTTRAYPVDDLVIPIPDARTLGGGALGGGPLGGNSNRQGMGQNGDMQFGQNNNPFGALPGQNNQPQF